MMRDRNLVVKCWFGNGSEETLLFQFRILYHHLPGKTEENFIFERI
jgi:hypothetical protein